MAEKPFAGTDPVNPRRAGDADSARHREEELRLPLFEEVAEVTKRAVSGDRVRVIKTVRTREEMVETALRHEAVEVTRVPVGRTVEAVPDVREEGDTLIVPVVEEELVVTRRLVLREEIHLKRHVRTETVRQPVTLRVEEAEVERLPPEASERGPSGTGL